MVKSLSVREMRASHMALNYPPYPAEPKFARIQITFLEFWIIRTRRNQPWIYSDSFLKLLLFHTRMIVMPKMRIRRLPWWFRWLRNVWETSTIQETRVQSLGWEDPLEKEIATHSGIIAWKIPWMEEPGGLRSMGSQRVGHDWATSLPVRIPALSYSLPYLAMFSHWTISPSVTLRYLTRDLGIKFRLFKFCRARFSVLATNLNHLKRFGSTDT